MRVRARIDREALANNLALLRKLAPASRILAVVKADGYGHGLIHAAQALATADGFGVTSVEEALELRESGFRGTVVVLEGALAGKELKAAAAARLDLVVHADWQLDMLERDGSPANARFWVKFDTGMHRLGFPTATADRVRTRLDAIGAANTVLMSHLACADEPSRPETERQLQAFDRLRGFFPGAASLANSAGLLAHPATHCDWVRPGLALYGVSPVAGRAAGEFGLRPAMTLTSRILSIREVAAGEAVGYGAAWRATRASRIGIVSIGYGDGYPWRSISTGFALVAGRRIPLAGRVSMDMLGLDLTELPDVGPGDVVTLWGEGLPVEEVARAAGTTPYE
ncbi:MAG TPA: alanine racemase, partial [Gammaproteobacteria bacterium]|nr:alanine racemase [Gammaproteobacteria bacterium]